MVMLRRKNFKYFTYNSISISIMMLFMLFIIYLSFNVRLLYVGLIEIKFNKNDLYSIESLIRINRKVMLPLTMTKRRPVSFFQ